MTVLVWDLDGYRQEYDLPPAEVERILGNQRSFLREAARKFGRTGLPEPWQVTEAPAGGTFPP